MLGGKGGEPRVKGYFREFFSDRAEIEHWEAIYDRRDFLGYCLRMRMSQALSWLEDSDLPEDSVILDMGCGTGIITREVARRGYKVIGVDYSYGMLREARGICNADDNPEVKLLQADVESLPFRDSSFSLILCLGVITYLESEGKALREFSRVLKPYGTLVLSSRNKAYLGRFFDLPVLLRRSLSKLVSSLKRASGSRIADRKGGTAIKKSFPKYRRYSTPDLKISLERQGFSVLEYMTVPLGLLTFFGQTIPPRGINLKITLFLEKFTELPFIGTLGGMCIFRARKGL